jgi:hypothetical protein
MKKHQFHLNLLPNEPLIGIGVINSKIGTSDKTLQNCIGIELGLLFFRFTYLMIK